MNRELQRIRPRIERLAEKKLVGQMVKMSLVTNKTFELWSQFGPRIKEIKNRVSQDKLSLQVYTPNYFKSFSPTNQFEKWALVEVGDINFVPEGMMSFVLNPGLYAVFDHTASNMDDEIFRYIYEIWVPQSQYQLDDRPHFEVLGSKYKNNDPSSEEEVWIPIKLK